MATVLALVFPVAIVCVIVAILVVALMRYSRCPSNNIIVCCPEQGDCCPDNCPDSVLPKTLFAQNVTKGTSQLSLSSKDDVSSFQSKLQTPSLTSGATGSLFSSSKTGYDGSVSTPPPPGMYRTQYKRVSIRPPSSDESEEEVEKKVANTSIKINTQQESSSPRSTNAFQFPPTPSTPQVTFVETNPVIPAFTAGIPVQNSPPVPPSQFRPTGDGQEESAVSYAQEITVPPVVVPKTPSSPLSSPTISVTSNQKQPLGTLRILIANDTTVDQMSVTILDLNSNSLECNIVRDGCRVTLMVLPEKKFKYKTSIVKGGFPLAWNKSFTFSVGNQIDMLNTSLRFRVYASESLLSKSQLVCQRLVRLEDLPLDHYSNSPTRAANKPIALDLFASADDDDEDWTGGSFHQKGHQKGSSRSSSLSRKSSDDNENSSLYSNPIGSVVGSRTPPSVLLGLAYNFNTGRLIVEVHRAANLRLSAGAAPDSFVTVAMSSKSERKTSMKKANASPVYMENFVFEVAMTHLTLCFVKIIVFVKHNRTKRKLGGVHLSLNSPHEDIRNHWKQMMHSEGSSIVKWYTLSEEVH